jgi:hypothetical protein
MILRLVLDGDTVWWIDCHAGRTPWVSEVWKAPLSDLASKTKVLEGKFRSLAVCDQSLLLALTTSIAVYRKDGSWMTCFGEPGSAPGQFRAVGQLCAWGSTLLACDGGNRRVQMFHWPSGQYVRHLESGTFFVLERLDVAMTQDEVFVVCWRGLWTFSHDGTLLRTLQLSETPEAFGLLADGRLIFAYGRSEFALLCREGRERSTMPAHAAFPLALLCTPVGIVYECARRS